MPKSRESDPLLGFNFALEIGGKVKGYFSEVGGIGSESEVIEHKGVDEKGNDLVQKIPGRLKWTDITLKRGITSNMDVWDWRDEVATGKVADARRNGSVIMFDRSLTPVAHWDFTNGWPSKVTGPTLKADSNDFGIEEMVIAHEGIKRVK
jgi:phage tail-like protein